MLCRDWPVSDLIWQRKRVEKDPEFTHLSRFFQSDFSVPLRPKGYEYETMHNTGGDTFLHHKHTMPYICLNPFLSKVFFFVATTNHYKNASIQISYPEVKMVHLENVGYFTW